MPSPKFSFVPERQLNASSESETYKVSIFKNGQLVFPTSVLDVYELEGKYLKLFADIEKKAIGWSIIEGTTDFTELEYARLIKKDKNQKVARLGITKILRNLNIDTGTSFLKLEVKQYKSALQDSAIWYIELPTTKNV